MEKLELKHLAPYLPYGLKVYYKHKNKLLQLTGLGFQQEGESYVFNTWCAGLDDLDLKPILRPLSDLTKEISNGVGLFYPYEELHLCYSDVTNFLNEDLWIGQWWDYEKVSKLFEWHFDVFGLIEKGLAIDINKLAKTK